MKFPLPLFLSLLALAPAARAYPPAPVHEIYGMVRNETGRPLDGREGLVILYGSTTNEITRAPTDSVIGPGLNYSLNVPMDSGIFPGFYQPNALSQGLPFTIRVTVNNVPHVPIQMAGNLHNIGRPGERTRLDLVLGVDLDGDGLSDAWEQLLVDSDNSGALTSIANVLPGDDLDGDGLTNLQEFLLGTYAIDNSDGLSLAIVDFVNDRARLRFTGVTSRTYGITVSHDLVNWTPASFSRTPTGAVGTVFLAPETSIYDVYAPVAQPEITTYFRLHAQ